MEDFKKWQDSGKFMPRKEFESKFTTIKLKGACDDVLIYDGGYHIQVLWDGTFYDCNTNMSKDLDEVELNLYQNKIDKKLYN
jgi:hypothetical protein